jgi:hypothetical protein
MSFRVTKLPARLREEGSAFEQRLLDAASLEEPSRELSERMARAIGVSAAASPAGGDGAGAGSEIVTPKAVAGSSAVTPWVAGAIVAAAAAGTFLALRPSAKSPEPRAPSTTVAVASASTPSLAAPVDVAAPPTETPELPKVPADRNRVRESANDLQGQIALVEAARAAVSAGAGQRALDILGRYQDKFGTGSFQPETTALRIEALVRLGRTTEAQPLARRFAAEHPGSPLAERVSRLASLPSPR